MKLAIGADHAGFELKESVKAFLEEMGHDVVDVGTHSRGSVDYPDFARVACRKVLDGEVERAVLVCGTGVGMSMAANRFEGIRAVLCTNQYLARFSRLHNDANVICLPGRLMEAGIAEQILKTWLSTEFEGGRHQRRLLKLERSADPQATKP